MRFPTGGDAHLRFRVREARERLLGFSRRGQQIRCDSEADGYSPDGRERVDHGRRHRLPLAGHRVSDATFPYALIPVTDSED